ncbi:MAG: hypothetical protein ACRC8R_14920 [Aeromonas hydrophila]
MKKLCVLVLSVSLAGCATPKYNYIPNSVDVSEPPIGTVMTAQVGEQLLRQGRYTENDALMLTESTNIGYAYTLTPGYYIKHGEDGDSAFYLPSGEIDGGKVDKAALADPVVSIQAYKNQSKICAVTVFHAVVCEDGVAYKTVKKPVFTTTSFQQTLIYSGRVGTKINIGYREFSGNIARPAFNNDVEYDLSESHMIGYKGAKLEIIEATNEHIKFKVISNFNVAAQMGQ